MKKRKIPKVDVLELSARLQKQIGKLQVCAESLLAEVYAFEEIVARMADEINILKGLKKRPVFKPSRMHQEAATTEAEKPTSPASKKRAGSAKKSKTGELLISRDCIIEPLEPIPPGSRFKGYSDFIVQDIVITPANTRYRLARWQTPEGRTLKGELPAELHGGHFGPTLVSYVLYQYHHCQVTQPLLHEQLNEWGVGISTGQIDAILQKGKQAFHDEKDAILSAGLALSPYVTVDDTGARHQGNNGYVTHIGNEHFAFFQSSQSKSRVNFLELLHAGPPQYKINTSALRYMKEQQLPNIFLDALRNHAQLDFTNKNDWHAHLKALGITKPNHQKTSTEGALQGALEGLHVATNLAIVSDDAGQFNVLTHGLCWVHAERLVHKMVPLNEYHRVDLASVRSQIWKLYADLKMYQKQPDANSKVSLAKRFDTIFKQKTSYTLLNQLLGRIHQNKAELLLVLERPNIPLHTNNSECDIRDYVKKRKISGGTRSDTGRRCRDTFNSLKKTCRKLRISFWDYLLTRISGTDHIAPLPHIIAQRIASA